MSNTPEDTELREAIISIEFPDGLQRSNTGFTQIIRNAQEKHIESLMNLITLHTQEAEIALARKVLGVSSMVHKQKGITQSMRLKHLTKEMLKIIPDTFGLIEDHLTNPTETGEK